MTASPTIGEATIRLWNRLPSLAKSLIPSLCALLIVLLPANLLISSRFYQITAENLRAQHQALLTQIGSAFEEFLSAQSLYLSSLANREAVKSCAANGCADQSESLFGAELKAHLKDADAYYAEIGFLDASGQETARALRGNGGQVLTPGDTAMFKADSTALTRMQNQVYLFPVSRDARLSPTETYQQPALRFTAPVDSQGYVTVVLSLDNLFAQNFVPSDTQQVLLLDSDKCLLASSDDTRRAELYKTWSSAPDRTCYPDFPAEDWDITVQDYRDTIISTHVIHGPLSQPWMIVVQQPVDLAYAQARALQTLLSVAHLFTVIFVAALIIAADRAGKRLTAAHRNRLIANARNMRFNPYLVDTPIQDKRLFFGRTEALAQVIGLGVMGGDDVLIVGDKHIGKTSVLRQVERRLREQSVADPVYRYWPVVISARGIPANAFYATLMEFMLRDVEEGTLPADLRFRQHHEYYGLEDFRKDAADLLNLPNADGRSTRLVLCLDDIHCWLDEKSGYTPAFRETFRRLFGDVGGGLKLIAAGNWSAQQVFGDTLYEVRLGPLNAAEAAHLVREPVVEYYTFADDAVESILERSNLLPLEIQRLAHHTVQVMLDQEGLAITRAHVNLAFKRAVADWEPAFRLLRYGGTDHAGDPAERLSDLGYAALRDLATRDAPIDREYYTGETPILTRAQLDDIAFTDAQGNLRLKAVFKAWLAR